MSPASACSATFTSSRPPRASRRKSTQAAVPAIDGVLDLLADERALAGGSRRNRADADTFTTGRTASPTRSAASAATR